MSNLIKTKKTNLKIFSNFISLGYFCSVALELERLGYRNFSNPFDWLISDFKGVLELIENDFENFLSMQYLFQNKKNKY